MCVIFIYFLSTNPSKHMQCCEKVFALLPIFYVLKIQTQNTNKKSFFIILFSKGIKIFHTYIT